MAEIKCPMCGKPNPEEALNCSFCQARLKPPGWQPEETAPEWLRDLQPEAFGSAPQPPKDEEEPLWLAELRGIQPAEDAPGGAANEISTEETIPGWIRELPPQEENLPTSTEESQNEDWMNRLRSFDSPPTPPAEDFSAPASQTTPKPAEEPGEEDWMEKLSAWQRESISAPGSADEKTISDAFLDSGDEAPASDSGLPASFPDGGLPLEDSGSEIPSWLNELPPLIDEAGSDSEFSASAAGESETIPGWMNEASSAAPSSSAEPSDELPDWLKDFSSSDEKEASDQEFLASPSEAELPVVDAFGGWEPSPVEPAPKEDLFSELPEWLDGLSPEPGSLAPSGMESIPEEQTLISQPAPAEPGPLPDWLAADEGGKEEEQPAEMQTPEWLLPLVQGRDEEAVFTSEPAEHLQVGIFGREEAGGLPEPPLSDETGFPAADEKTVSALPFKEEALPDWLRETSKEEIPERVGSVPPFNPEDLPDWLSDSTEPVQRMEEPVLEEKGLPSAQAPTTPPFVSDGFLDWFEEESEAKPAAEEGEPSPEVEPGALPAWVSAMRPLEAVALSAEEALDDRKVESHGPLAGLRSLLTAEEAVLEFTKPPVYSLKLQVTEKQRVQASLLETMLENESKGIQEKPTAARSMWRLIRLILGMLLIFMTALPIFINPSGAGASTIPMSISAQSAYAVIDQVPADSTVLVGLDFNSGYAGELDLAGSAVLTHLMQRQAKIVMVATDPAVPALGEWMVKNSVESGLVNESLKQEYQNRQRFVNLGYLPGGTASLQEFALRPRQAAYFGFFTPLDGIIPWNTPILVDIERLDQFAAVIVITDRLEGGQAWIEQVQPKLGHIPLVLVSSAQATPLLEPYFQSGQVQGLVSGLAGGDSYRARLSGLNTSSSTWSAYQSGVIFCALALLAGAVIYGVAALLEKGKESR